MQIIFKFSYIVQDLTKEEWESQLHSKNVSLKNLQKKYSYEHKKLEITRSERDKLRKENYNLQQKINKVRIIYYYLLYSPKSI